MFVKKAKMTGRSSLPSRALVVLMVFAAVAIQSCCAQSGALLQTNPPFKPRDVRKLAAALVARRDAAKKNPKTPKVVLGYSNKATIKVPKGTKDALQYFKQAAAAIAKKGGGIWQVEAGTYILSDGFNIQSSNTHFMGAGIDKTIIKVADQAPVWQGAGFLRARGVQGISISDMTFDGNKKNQVKDMSKHYGKYGNYMDQYKDVLFQRVKIVEFLRYGFDPHGYNKKLFSDGLIVMDCISNNNQWDGFTFDQTFNIYAKNNSANGNGRHGFNIITGDRNVIIEYTQAINSGFGEPSISHGGMGCGYMIDNLVYPLGTRDVTLQYNLVNGAKTGGFCTQGVTNITMVRNTITNVESCADIRYQTTRSAFSYNKCSKFVNKVKFTRSEPTEITVTGNVYNPKP